MRSLLFENGLIKWQAFLFLGRLYFKKRSQLAPLRFDYLKRILYKKSFAFARWRHLDLEFFPPHTI